MLLLCALLLSNAFLLCLYISRGGKALKKERGCELVSSLTANDRVRAIREFERVAGGLGCLDGGEVLDEDSRVGVFLMLADIYASRGDCSSAGFCLRMAGRVVCNEGAMEKYVGVGNVPEIDAMSRGTTDLGYRRMDRVRNRVHYSEMTLDCKEAGEIERRIAKRCD